MEILSLINKASNLLRNRNILSHRLDAEVLLSKILNTSREALLTSLDKKISNRNADHFNELINRRSKKEPVAYILQEKEFWSKKFYLNSNVLIPRPETELMVDKIVKIHKKKNLNILDIGTGTGCILISILSELKNSKGTGVDISPKAIKIAKINSIKLNLQRRVLGGLKR